jgi:hypothetical protein
LGSLDDALVDDGELLVGVRLGTGRDGVAPEEADADDQVVALVDQALEALGAVAVTGGVDSFADDAELGRRPGRDPRRGVVERAVATTGDVEQQPDADGEQLLALDHVLPFRMNAGWYMGRPASVKMRAVFTHRAGYPPVRATVRTGGPECVSAV